MDQIIDEEGVIDGDMFQQLGDRQLMNWNVRLYDEYNSDEDIRRIPAAKAKNAGRG